jgi:hypothetical protein
MQSTRTKPEKYPRSPRFPRRPRPVLIARGMRNYLERAGRIARGSYPYAYRFRANRQTMPRVGAKNSASRKKAVHTSTIAAPDATLT